MEEILPQPAPRWQIMRAHWLGISLQKALGRGMWWQVAKLLLLEPYLLALVSTQLLRGILRIRANRRQSETEIHCLLSNVNPQNSSEKKQSVPSSPSVHKLVEIYEQKLSNNSVASVRSNSSLKGRKSTHFSSKVDRKVISFQTYR